MSDEWRPARVVKLDNENRGLMKQRDDHARAVVEIDAKIADNNAKIQAEYGRDREAEAAV